MADGDELSAQIRHEAQLMSILSQLVTSVLKLYGVAPVATLTPSERYPGVTEVQASANTEAGRQQGEERARLTVNAMRQIHALFRGDPMFLVGEDE